MKRVWIGVLLLLVLLAAGLGTTWYMEQVHEEIADRAEAAGQLALSDDWEGADRLLGRIRESWQRHRKLSAALTDHGSLEEIDGLLAQLAVYGRQREKLSFAALCAQLESRLEDLGEAEALNWWNVL